jgi:hypothetical protein
MPGMGEGIFKNIYSDIYFPYEQNLKTRPNEFHGHLIRICPISVAEHYIVAPRKRTTPASIINVATTLANPSTNRVTRAAL